MKKITSIILLSLILLCFTGCSYSTPEESTLKSTNFVSIENNLYYDKNTKIVYIIFEECGGYQGYGFMSPYIASNGLPYKYEDNQMIEIGEHK